MTNTDLILVKRYELLENFQKRIIQLFASASEPLNISQVFNMLQQLRIHPLGASLKSKDIPSHIFLLLNDTLLLPDGKDKFVINKRIQNIIVRDLHRDQLFNNYTEALNQFLPLDTYSYWQTPPLERYYANIRIALLKRNTALVNSLVSSAKYKHTNFSLDTAFNILLHPFDEKWLLTMPDSVIHAIFLNALEDLKETFQINKSLFDFVEQYKQDTKNDYQQIFRDGIKWRYIFEGNEEKLKSIIYDTETLETSLSASFRGSLEFFKGNYEVNQLIDATHKYYRRETGKRNSYAPHLSLQYLYLAYLSQNSTEGHALVIKYLKGIKSTYIPLSNTLIALAYAQKNEMNTVQHVFKSNEDEGLGLLFINYANFWIYRDEAKINYESLERLYKSAEKSGFIYIQLLINDLLINYYQYNEKGTLATDLKTIQESLLKQTSFVSIVDLMPKVEPWERSITALLDLSNQFEQNISTSLYNKRLIWLIDFQTEILQAKEQKIGKTGKWTKGKNISHDQMYNIINYDEENYFSSQDIQIINSIHNSSYYNYSSFDLTGSIVKALVGHPNLYLNNEQRTNVEISLEQPQLVVESNGSNYELKFNVPVETVGVKLLKETPTRYKAVEITEQHLKIANAIGQDKVLIPKDSEEKIAKIVKGFSKIVNVQSELLAQDIDVTSVESSPTPHLHILPVGEGFELEIYVKPFGGHPPYFKPGSGGKVLLTEHNGERFQTERDLALEKKLAKAIVKACPSFGDNSNLKKIWEFATPEDCLEILTELQPLKEEEKIILEWPKGERLKLKGTASMGNFTMNIKGSTDWFEANGTLKVGEDLVLSMKELLGLLDSNESRFIKLKNGEFLALTKKFQQQLKAMEAYGDVTEDGIRFHPLAAYAIDGIANEAEQLETDSAFKAQIQKLKDAEKKTPTLPSTFKAELRTYQTEGYNWLMKLANWEVGACLADDMGLGKTVQALAAILTRASVGPTLVVCPASVRTNWEREALKFAPTLNPIQFGDGDRQEILNALKPYDVIITSYGLMQTELENLKEIKFSTIVLDEAQAIKNKNAKRSKAAMELQGDFKILTTGTPIENHLGELWNLFRFINPGLLGSSERFKERFAIPISKYGDDIRREQLKKLIRPFILRRRKSDVLLELPEKTEVVLSVTLSPAEKAFYEALRQSAVDKLAEMEPGKGATHLKILAEIMRLRQACCNPKLVQKDSPIKSSKLELFNETIGELLENGHKVLVFSQFVQHLKILEQNLQSRDISYQYLDGSTSRKRRQAAIDNFQAGNGDVFLISLKAGGVGLNLTAADYVIHMDPWWNPAVEDQASDRAHRIGQKRPVTIYRLVTEGTIEEKIVQLHGQKRDLADSLLDGTNAGNKISATDLMNLIKEGMRN